MGEYHQPPIQDVMPRLYTTIHEEGDLCMGTISNGSEGGGEGGGEGRERSCCSLSCRQRNPNPVPRQLKMHALSIHIIIS